MISFLREGLQFSISVGNDLLQLGDFSLVELDLVVVSISQESEFRLFDAFEFVAKITELKVGNSLSFKDFILQVLILFLKDLNGVLIVIFHFDILSQNLLNLRVLGVYHFL